MYDINLIRETVVPERHKRVLFSLVSVAVFAFALTGLAVVFFSMANMRVIDVYAKELHNLEEHLSLLYPGTPTHEELCNVFTRIQPDLTEIASGMGTRIEMTRMWEGLTAAVPDSVWLTGVTLTIPDKSRGGGKGRSREGRILLEGKAMTADGQRGSALIREFANRIEISDVLKKHVSDAKFVETDIDRIGGTEVIGFEITCVLK